MEENKDTTGKGNFWEKPISRRKFIGAITTGATAIATGAVLPEVVSAKEQTPQVIIRTVDKEILNNYGLRVQGLGREGLLLSEKGPEESALVTVSEIIDPQGERAGLKLAIPVECLVGGNELAISFNEAEIPAAVRTFGMGELSGLIKEDSASGNPEIVLYCFDRDFSRQITGISVADKDTTEGLLSNVVVAEGELNRISKATVTVNSGEFKTNEEGQITLQKEPTRFYAGIFDKATEEKGKADFNPNSPQG